MAEARHLKATKRTQDPEPLRLQDVSRYLEGDTPAWFLDMPGRVLAANPTCFWLWGTRNRANLLGISAYQIYRLALASGHMPKVENHEAIAKKIKIAEYLREHYDDPAYQAFLDYVNGDDSLRKLVDIRLGTREAWQFASWYDYPLRLTFPVLHGGDTLLTFRIKVYRLPDEVGWLSAYEPLGGATKATFAKGNKLHIQSFPATLGTNRVHYLNHNVKEKIERWRHTQPMEREIPSSLRAIQSERQPDAPSEHQVPPAWEPPAFAAEVMSQPDVTLHIGANPESKEAFEILDAAGVTCKIDRSNHRRIPSVTWGGLTFKGAGGMTQLAEMLRDMDRAVGAAIAENPAKYAKSEQPGLATWKQETRQQLSAEARHIVYDAKTARRHPSPEK